MFIYDNTQNKRKINSLTVSFDIEGEEILYTYIRKNACTSFKNIIAYYSLHDFKKAGSRLKGMEKYHRVKAPVQAANVKNRVFVYRDPIERVISVFKNKFIQLSGANDIIKNFSEVSGVNVEECSFNGFVENYVMKIAEGVSIDAHLLPQQWHLLPITYNRAIPLKLIKEGMADMVGEDVANKFFSKPFNATSHSSSFSSSYCGDVSIKDLRNLYISENTFPSSERFLTPRTIGLLKLIYSDDYRMLDNIHS